MAINISNLSLPNTSLNTLGGGRNDSTASGTQNSLSDQNSLLSLAQLSYSREVMDSVEISAAARQASSENGTTTSGEFSARVIHQERIQLQISYTSAASTSGEPAERPSLAQVMEDVKGAFESILQQLRDSLAADQEVPQRARLSMPNHGLAGNADNNANPEAPGNSLDAETDKLLRGYLGLLRHFEKQLGENSNISKAIESLEAYLEGGQATQTTQEIPANPEAGAVASSETMTVDISVEITQMTEVRISFGEETQSQDPIVIDVDGDGIEASGVKNGVRFDLNGDGVKEQTAFATGGDGVLVLDRNGNGQIDSGKELFGDQHGASNGFAELAKYDGNNDRTIDAGDSVFSRLKVWVDQNADGASQEEELLSMMDAGIKSINLSNRDTDRSINGNRIAQDAYFTRTNGTQGTAADVLLNYIA